MRPTVDETLRDLAYVPSLSIRCANPHCESKVIYRGQLCAVCDAQIRLERERLRRLKEAK